MHSEMAKTLWSFDRSECNRVKTDIRKVNNNITKIAPLTYKAVIQQKLLFNFNIIVMCLSIATPINNKFSICLKWKINYFRCPKI